MTKIRFIMIIITLSLSVFSLAESESPYLGKMDLNDDGAIDKLDLLLFYDYWHKTNPTPTPSAPKLEILDQNFDFGQVLASTIVEHIFTIKNTGGSNLEIYYVKATCGCTGALLSNSVIIPNSTAEIRATFNTTGYSGRVSKTVDISSNDPKSFHQIVFYATVVPMLSLSPSSIGFGEVIANATSIASATLAKYDKSPFEITSVKGYDTSKYSISASPINEDRSIWQITGTKFPEEILGNFYTSFTIETNVANYERMYINLNGTVQAKTVSLMPAEAFLGYLKVGSSYSLDIWMYSKPNYTGQINIVGIECSRPEVFAATYETVVAGSECKITVSVSNLQLPEGSSGYTEIQGILTIQFDNPDEAEIKIKTSVWAFL